MNEIVDYLDTYLGKLHDIHNIILDYHGYYHIKDMKEIINLGDMVKYNNNIWDKYSRTINIDRFKNNLLFIKKNINILAKINNININNIHRVGGSCCMFIRSKRFNDIPKETLNTIYIDNKTIYTPYGEFIITTDKITNNIYNLYKEYLNFYKDLRLEIERDNYYDNTTLALNLPYNIIVYPNQNTLKKYINEIIL